jgi:hypothetical protein
MRTQTKGGNHLVLATIRLIMFGAIRNIMGSNLTWPGRAIGLRR